jgi:hypothetical protein
MGLVEWPFKAAMPAFLRAFFVTPPVWRSLIATAQSRSVMSPLTSARHNCPSYPMYYPQVRQGQPELANRSTHGHKTSKYF